MPDPGAVFLRQTAEARCRAGSVRRGCEPGCGACVAFLYSRNIGLLCPSAALMNERGNPKHEPESEGQQTDASQTNGESLAPVTSMDFWKQIKTIVNQISEAGRSEKHEQAGCGPSDEH